MTPEPLPVVGPLSKYVATASPEAIPVIEGCGIAGLLYLAMLFFLLFVCFRGERFLVRLGVAPFLRVMEAR